MSIPSIPQNFVVSQGNGQVFLSWAIVSGATSYTVQRSTDGVVYSNLATINANSFLDTTSLIGVQYFYQVASVNISGVSPFTAPQSVVPTPAGEMSLGEIRQRAQQRADRVNSEFVTQDEWNFFINQAVTELYDLMIAASEDYFVAPPVHFQSVGGQYIYDLPNGQNSFLDKNNVSFVPPPFYKLMGVDLGINSANNAYVTVTKFNFIDRNKFVYPNTASTIYGVFNLRYRLLGNQIEFIPTPSSGQPIQLWYVPRMKLLLADNDVTNSGINGWLQYVIIRAAKYALDKEESDTSKLDAELLFMKQRIEQTSVNRDIGIPDTISDVRNNGGFWGANGGGFGFNGPVGGF